MVNVGSLPMEGNRLFDLDTQAGITAVLLAVRASELEAKEKNDIRDLVFLYTNGGKDQSVRLSLEQKIAAAGLVPVTPKTAVQTPAEPKRDMPTIGTFRSAPSFAVPTAPVVAPVVKEVSAPPNPPAESVPEPVPVKAAPLFSSQPAAVPVAKEASPHEDIVVPPVAMPKADQQQYLERIREIKSLVNEKVGNPVNLVDINNEVGREYMSALLDAMKRINSGMSADGAMQRLEAAYVAVEETLKNVSEATPVPTPQVEPAPHVQQADILPVRDPAPFYTPSAQQVAYEPVVPVSVPVSQYQPVAPAPTAYEPVAPAPHFQSMAESVVPPVQHYEQVTPAPVVPTPSYVTPSAPTVHTPAPHTFSSLADMVQQSHAQTGLPTTPTQAAPLQSGDPLLSPQVEEGLTQLLSEWSIFKKSGIFGSGPKGREHPLYKKMADLQIPLLLAGRFEGATQEVRQSLTDYMNGWRYEQGLIYEKGETFEHYLRRVIKHILEQQQR